MKLSKLSKLAGVSAIALTLATSANAATVQNGGNIPIQITATVTNSFEVTTTNLIWDSIDVRGASVDVATADLNPGTGAITDDVGAAPGDAAIEANAGNASAAAVVTATELPNDTAVTVDYNTMVELNDGTSEFDVALLDNLNAITDGVSGTAGSMDFTGTTVPGTATTSATGTLEFNIGGSIRTQAGDGYDPGAYTGSFNVTIAY